MHLIEGPRIYNVFPLLAGPFSAWRPHLERASRMGFNWIFTNPVQRTGISGSLYSIADYYGLNPLLVDAAAPPEQQLRQMIGQVHDLGMKLMVDLVINHTAADSPLTRQHPQWYRHNDDGEIVHPGAYRDNEWITWEDLASVENLASPDRDRLWAYWLEIVRHYASLGFDGFRCDAAYQVPAELWRYLIGTAKRGDPNLKFFAETLGCTPEQTLAVADTGFDYIFNSAKWWDFAAPWCLDQLRQTAPVVPSISFPESHDTERLAAELNGNRDAVRQRYAFSALFSSGVMIPMGFEYGFRRRLHVVSTRPEHWESPSWDDTDFIREVNAFKAAQGIFNEDAPWEFLDSGNPQIAAFRKLSRDGAGRAVLALNQDGSGPQRLRSVEELLTEPAAAVWPPAADAPSLPRCGIRVAISR
jgi:starch synthase (maltosyl-transferring)